MVENNASKKEKHKFYNATVPTISIVVGDCATNIGAMCARFFDMGSPMKTQVENGLSKLLGFGGQTIDMSDQVVLS